MSRRFWNRRGFLASLMAPFVARFLPKSKSPSFYERALLAEARMLNDLIDSVYSFEKRYLAENWLPENPSTDKLKEPC